MNRTAGSMLILPFLFIPIAGAQTTASPQRELRSVITVSSTGKVKAKPDVAVVVLEIRSSAPLAADALQQNEKRGSEITAKLKDLGIVEKDVHFSGNQFAPSGGGRIYLPGGQRPTGFEVYNIFEVKLRSADISNLAAMAKRVATLLDELGKTGAGILSPDLSRISLGGSSAVFFAVEDPRQYEKQAYAVALEKARPIAEEIAQKMGVKITEIHSLQSASAPGVIASMPRGGYEVEYPYYASSPDDLAVRVSLTVHFSFK